MQERNRSVELSSGLFRTGDGKVNHAQRVVGMLMNLASRLARVARKQDEDQTYSQTTKDLKNCAFDRLNSFDDERLI